MAGLLLCGSFSLGYKDTSVSPPSSDRLDLSFPNALLNSYYVPGSIASVLRAESKQPSKIHITEFEMCWYC